MRFAIMLLAVALLAVAPGDASAAPAAKPAPAKSKTAKPRALPPTRATEPEIVADLIRYCAREALYVLHRPPPSAPYSRDVLIQTAHRIGNVIPQNEVGLISSSNPFDDCAYKRRTALYRGAPLLAPLERLPPVQQYAGLVRVKPRR